MAPISKNDNRFLTWYEGRCRGGRFDERVWGEEATANGARWDPAGSLAAEMLADIPSSLIVWGLRAPVREGDSNAAGVLRARKVAVFCRSLAKEFCAGRVSERVADQLIHYFGQTRPLPVRIRRRWERPEVIQVFLGTPEAVLCLSTWFGLMAKRLRPCKRCGDPFLLPSARSRHRFCPKHRQGLRTVVPRASQLATDWSRERWRLLRARLNQRVYRTENKRTARKEARLTSAARTAMLVRAFADLKRVDAGRLTNAAWEARWGERLDSQGERVDAQRNSL